MNQTLQQLLRKEYLRLCLKEITNAYKLGAYQTKQDYLSACKLEKNLHANAWKKEDLIIL